MGTGSHSGVANVGAAIVGVGNCTALGSGIAGGIGILSIATLTTVVFYIPVF